MSVIYGSPPYNYNLYVISKLPIVLVGGKLLITYLSTSCSVSTRSFILFSHVENCPETLNVGFFPFILCLTVNA